MRRLALLTAFLLPVALQPPAVQAQARTVYVVRHAEKVDASRDPELSERGKARADALAIVLTDAGVHAVIVTEFIRTRDTARPMTDALRLTPIVVPTASDVATHAAAVATAVRARPAGETVLVVGHSNTVAPIVAALGGSTMRDICDAQYANLIVLTVPDSGATRTTKVRYGAADPEDPSCDTAR